MPFYNTYRTKRMQRTFGRGYRARRYTQYNTQKGMGLIARPMGRPAPEIKAYDSSVAASTTNLITTVVGQNLDLDTGMIHLNGVVQGSTFYQRVGNKITIKSLDIRFVLVSTGTTVNNRVMVVYDRQPNGAYPLITDILATSTGTTTGLMTPVNIQNRSRFSIIRNQLIPVDAGGGLSKEVSLFCKGRWDSEYNGSNTGTIGDITTGSLLFIVFSDQVYEGTACHIDQFTCRIRYFD